MSQPSAPNNDVDLGAQAQQAAAAQALQQQQWQAEQNATNQASQVSQQTAQQATNQLNQQNAVQQQGFNQQNQTQGAAQNATGGPAGIKAAATIQNNTAGLSLADAKLQAAGVAASPTSLASLMQKRAAMTPAISSPGSTLLTNTSVKLGGS